MTNEEVIRFLIEDLQDMYSDDEKYRRPYYEQAISALENEELLNQKHKKLNEQLEKLKALENKHKDIIDTLDEFITLCHDRSHTSSFELDISHYNGMKEGLKLAKKIIKEGDKEWQKRKK